MASLIPGFEYDIFISYRQKDNKYDGWVTEFVDNLTRELDSMFKEEISVYFDINPSDYLLENYDVDASLKDKLKCLVFIPVISRTYCDPKSFAWEYEFKPFIEHALEDQFGMKVKLPNGNTASRVLPVRIHDLDSSDVDLYETTMVGVLRPIDFIYKETGVNRQLRAKDDDIIKNPGQVLYRDQINKIALAVREIILSMKSQETEDKKVEEVKKDEEVEQTPVKPGINKDQDTGEKKGPSRKVFTGRSLLWILVFLVVTTGIVLLINYQSKVKWAKEEALKEASELALADFFLESFTLAKKAEKYIPKDTVLQDVLTEVSSYQTIHTYPPGADIYWKEYSDTLGEWIHIGKSPIDSLQVPKQTVYRFQIIKSGYDTLFGAVTTMTTIGGRLTRQDTLSRKLFKSGEIPEGMVYVDGYWDEVKDGWNEELGFFLDKYEVTNKQFKEFIDHGGYRKQNYWKHEFLKDGITLPWDEAMAEFIDQTGRPGPSTWAAGDYPKGKDDYPVSGISWYEAVAYAEFRGKVLPSADHWDSGVGFQFIPNSDLTLRHYVPLSNFSSPGTIPVGIKPGISFYGAFDMAGNVREWCWNKTNMGHIISGGGGYDSPEYMFSIWDHIPPFDRSPINGFRCALYKNRERIPETAFRNIDLGIMKYRDITSETPVSESIFNVYKNQFQYDKKELNTVIEMKDESNDDWIMEKVTFDAAYDNQRMITYIILPRNASPPYQTLIFFPGSYAKTKREISIRNIISEFDFIVNSGRAGIYPIYLGTWERYDASLYSAGTRSHENTERLIRVIKDFSRTIDYLETRHDIDTDKLGYFGYSWGGALGAVIPAVEDRLSLSILKGAGFSSIKGYPEVNQINYITRVKVPTLILNGRYDSNFPLETNLRPFFNLLGTPDEDKRLFLIDSGHNFYKRNSIAPFLDWCDKYFGPPKYLQNE